MFKSQFKNLLLSASVIAGSIAVANAADYKVKTILTPDEDGAMAYLINYDTGAKVDSVTVADSVAVFQGKLDAPFAARLIIDGQRAGQFFVEEGLVEYDAKTRKTNGGAFNKLLSDIQEQTMPIAARFKEAQTDSARKEIYAEYTKFMENAMLSNIDNPVGYLLFLEQAYDMEPAELSAFVEKNPSLLKYKRVEKLLQANKNKAATQPGCKFADFEIEYDGVKHRLSDVVGKGDYVLVDFWASWCGPCIRQTAVIKDLYNEYKDKGLKVLGVAVWDEPDATKQAIKDHDLPWEAWLNGQNVPTDIYGISGIPCIILFGPDGTILSRDKQDDALKADVRAALEKAN